MAQIKLCDRCGKKADEANDIGVVLDVFSFRVNRGYIRPGDKLLQAAKESMPDIVYLPLHFKEGFFGNVELCSGCFKEFMHFKDNPTLISQPLT